MRLLADLRVIRHMVLPRAAGLSHAERLEAFYRGQARGYDDFRQRLLHGREELMRSLALPDGAVLIDMGGGTGSNLEHLKGLARLRQAVIVDLSPSLLKVARKRIRERGWRNVEAVLADATAYEPEAGRADAVTFSYSLTMMPDWFAAVDRARDILKPGGLIGVTDFYISRRWPEPGLRRHSRFQRLFWPLWFGWDGVFLSPDHLPYLRQRFQTLQLAERLGTVPWTPGLKAPYYIFIGRKLQAGPEGQT